MFFDSLNQNSDCMVCGGQHKVKAAQELVQENLMKINNLSTQILINCTPKQGIKYGVIHNKVVESGSFFSFNESIFSSNDRSRKI